MLRSIGILLLFFLLGCSKDNEEQKPLVFYVIGDWGRMGAPGQQVVSFQMDLWAEKEKPEFIVAAGDNFYDNGVVDTKDVHWQESFEKVYAGANIINTPWYVALGNHDYNGNPNAEVEYTKLSTRWKMPSRYFSMVQNLPNNGKARFVFTDTSPFEKSYYQIASLKDKVSAQDTLKQKKWMDSLTSLTDADWKIVIGHHHIYTGGVRKNEVNSVRSSFESLFAKNKVDVYFCGHEHDLQYLKAQNKPTHYFLSGTGSEIRPTGTIDQTIFSASIQGFMSVKLEKELMTVKIIDYKGNVLHIAEIRK